MIDRRTLIKAAGALPGLALAGCDKLWPHHPVHFKLSASGVVGGQPTSASTVYEVSWYDSILPQTPGEKSHWGATRTGDALVWDPGERGILVGLWEQVQIYDPPKSSGPLFGFRGWYPEPYLLLTPQQMNNRDRAEDSGEIFDWYRQSTIRAVVKRESWPILARVKNPNDLRSVEWVDPADVSASFGGDFELDGFLLEATEEPVSAGIEKKLPLLDSFLDPAIRKELGQISYQKQPFWGHVGPHNFMLQA